MGLHKQVMKTLVIKSSHYNEWSTFLSCHRAEDWSCHCLGKEGLSVSGRTCLSLHPFFVERRQWQRPEVFETCILEAGASWSSVQWLSQSPSLLRTRSTPASSGKLSGLFQPISTSPFFPSARPVEITGLDSIRWHLLLASQHMVFGVGCLRFLQLPRGLDSQVWLCCRLGHDLFSHGWAQSPAPVARRSLRLSWC